MWAGRHSHDRPLTPLPHLSPQMVRQTTADGRAEASAVERAAAGAAWGGVVRIADIRNMPTCVSEIPTNAAGVHESCLRAYHIVERTKDLLRRNVPAEVVLELIADMEGMP